MLCSDIKHEMTSLEFSNCHTEEGSEANISACCLACCLPGVHYPLHTTKHYFAFSHYFALDHPSAAPLPFKFLFVPD